MNEGETPISANSAFSSVNSFVKKNYLLVSLESADTASRRTLLANLGRSDHSVRKTTNNRLLFSLYNYVNYCILYLIEKNSHSHQHSDQHDVLYYYELRKLTAEIVRLHPPLPRSLGRRMVVCHKRGIVARQTGLGLVAVGLGDDREHATENAVLDFSFVVTGDRHEMIDNNVHVVLQLIDIRGAVDVREPIDIIHHLGYIHKLLQRGRGSRVFCFHLCTIGGWQINPKKTASMM